MRRSGKPARPAKSSKAEVKAPAKRRGLPSLAQRLAEAREQQAATSEILRIISSSPTDAQPVFDAVAAAATPLCAAANSGVFLFDGTLIHLAAHHNWSPEELEAVRQGFPRPPGPGSFTARAILTRRVAHTADCRTDPEFEVVSIAQVGFRATLSVPMLRDGAPIGAITVTRLEPVEFTDGQIALLETFARQAVIAIENVRLFKELEARNAALTEALDQQTATGEILRVISSSPTDIQPVFDAIVRSAVRLCDGLVGAVFRFDGDLMHLAAAHNYTPDALGSLQAMLPLRPQPDTPLTGARAILARDVVHVPDVLADGGYAHRVAQAGGFRSLLAVPTMREGRPIGAIFVGRTQAGPFSPGQIELLRTFADQAVIAIENVRLFTELDARNRDLGEALEQQTATGEILRVISSSPTDTQPVFDAIARSARALCDGDFATLARYDGQELQIGASASIGIEGVEAMERHAGRPTRAMALGRAIHDAALVHIPDVLADPEYDLSVAHAVGLRSAVAVPMLRDGAPIGAISVSRTAMRPFSDAQIGLLLTFADQAVIAIENVRLFKELEERNRALSEAHAQVSEALAQRTATSEILGVISGSPTDVQPVFDAIARSAMRLCAGQVGFVFQFDGDLLHFGACYGPTAEGLAAFRQSLPTPANEGSAAGRAILRRSVAHIPDVRADPAYRQLSVAESARFRGLVAAPMLRDGDPIGAITVGRDDAGPFADAQIALLKTFADQAVIAIQNVRLFTELQDKNRALTQAHAQVSEALDRQTATSEILRVISGSQTDVQPVFETIIASAVRLCNGRVGAVYRFDGELMHLAAHHNYPPGVLEILQEMHPRPPQRDLTAGRAIVERAVVQTEDTLLADSDYRQDVAAAGGFRSILAVPMLREGTPVGVIVITRREPGRFADGQIDLLRTFADQAVIAIENVRLFQELEVRNRDLTETLEQQTATSEILRVISQSRTDAQPVFDAIVRSAVRLCEGVQGTMVRFDGELLHWMASFNYAADVETLRRFYPRPPGREGALMRAVLDGATVHVPDTLRDPEYSHELLQMTGGRAVLAVPMLGNGQPIGAIAVVRRDPRPFSDNQITLLATFADQAVIAIENVRLFRELEARNRDLTETLEQQTATSEILRVISSSPTDVQPVFDTIAERAAKLCEARHAAVSRLDGHLVRLVALHNMNPEGSDALRGAFPMPLTGGAAGTRAIREREIVHIPDVEADFGYRPGSPMGEGAHLAGYRGVLAVPMLRETQAIGAIVVGRTAPGRFTDKQIDMLKTFADQAVIAIENVRLFQELETRTRDLTRSVEELTALGEVTRAISSTLDLETVLETIVSRAIQLSRSDQGLVYEFDEGTQSFHQRAAHQVSREHVEAMRAAPIRLGEGAIGRAGMTREPVQVPDLETEWALVAPQARELLRREGIRSLLAIPLVREARLLGGLIILRRVRGVFSPEIVAVLQTFATQSALAIHNAGLFREIQRQKQYSEALVETSPVAIVTMDLRGIVMGWNPGAVRLFGYTQEEALGQRLGDLVAAPEMRDEVQGNLRQSLEGERIHAMSRRVRKDGTLVDVEISAVPIVVGGAQVGVIGTYHDITELLRARREAEAANEAKSAFLATMSHEIRTPMNAVIGMSGLLLNTELGDDQREYAEVIRQSGDALLTVINDILDFSKIEAGRLELESQPFDLRECMEGALDLVATRAAEKGVDLAYVVGEGTPPGIVGDVTRLRQILLNLLSNAVKFTERGEVVLTVSARRPEGGLHALTFSVRDTGIGIPRDRLDRLFQSFSQVDASTTRRYGGTGLGLAISQRLTELMGGRIAVSSEVGAGSEFRFTIRAAAAEVPASSRRDLSGVQPSLSGKRVLVVDDNATNRRILTAHLDAWGMRARASGSPLEALGWIEAGERFDVGILDMHMPEMDGVALGHAIREQAAGATLPLILFTSLGRREARAESEGFAAYLNKPIKPSQLFDALVSVLPDQPVPVPQRGTARSEFDPDMARRHPLRILLAEDNVVNQKLALRLLDRMGYRADLAANGLEAIDAVERQTYDVVLMDVQMPDMDGFEASREINRRWPREGRPRIVAMTANAMQGDRELCEAAGMDDYVAKPIRVEELVAALERCQRRAEPEARSGPASDAAVGGADVVREPAGVSAGAADGSAAAVDVRARSVIDRAVYDGLAASMGDHFVTELTDTFIEDGRELIATLRRALAATDTDAFRRAAHSLKSNGETLGARSLATLARELEAMARARSVAGAEDRIGPLAREYEAAAAALRELRRGPAA